MPHKVNKRPLNNGDINNVSDSITTEKSVPESA